MAVFPTSTSPQGDYVLVNAWPQAHFSVRFAWDRSGTAIVTRGEFQQSEELSFKYAAPIYLERSAGSCDRLRLEIGPLGLVAADAPERIALRLPAIQSAPNPKRRRYSQVGRLPEQGKPARASVGHLNAVIPHLTCSTETP